MKLQQLRYFVAIVEHGLNISTASEKLFTSQPGVSKQIRMLEDELGVSLFVRKGRSLERLTRAGHAVLERATAILRETDNIKRVSADYRSEPAGELSIATTHTQARYVLPDVIRRFRGRYPNITVHVHQGTSEQIAELVQAGKADFAIASGDGRHFGDIVRLPCFDWNRIALVPRDHALAEQSGSLTLDTLARYPLVTYVFSFDGKSSLKSAFTRRGLRPEFAFTARDADVIKTYVRLGLGVGIIAEMAHDPSDEKDFVVFDAAGLFPPVTTWLGFRHDRYLQDYMYDFIALFAPQYEREAVDAAIEAPAKGQLAVPVVADTRPASGVPVLRPGNC